MPLPQENDELVARLARMRKLLDELETEVDKSAQQIEACERLRRDIEATRVALRLPLL